MHSVRLLFKYWDAQRQICLRQGLKKDVLSVIAIRRGLEIPDDFSAYLMRANGFMRNPSDDSMDFFDNDGFEFHPLEENSSLLRGSYFNFCTWHFAGDDYFIDLSSSKNGAVLTSDGDSQGRLVCNNFSEFIKMYINQFDELYSRSGPVFQLTGRP